MTKHINISISKAKFGAIAVALFLALLANFAVFYGRAASVRDNCRKIEVLKTYLLTQSIQSEKTLPTLEYYKTHPEELKIALEDIRLQEAFFAPAPCDLHLLGYTGLSTSMKID